MSKYIQLLLQNREEIKTTVLDEDLYDDLLIVEKKIAELHKKGLLSDADINVINYMNNNQSLRSLSKKHRVSRITLSQRFRNICNRLAFYLGGYFTDTGYLQRLKQKYKLTDEQISILIHKLNIRSYFDDI